MSALKDGRGEAQPSFFIAFDIWEDGRFLSVASRNALLAPFGAAFAIVPCIAARRRFTLAELLALVNETQSAFYDGPIEGIYVKFDEATDADDDDGAAANDSSRNKRAASTEKRKTETRSDSAEPRVSFNLGRAKLVRESFIAFIDDHWTSTKMIKNERVW